MNGHCYIVYSILYVDHESLSKFLNFLPDVRVTEMIVTGIVNTQEGLIGLRTDTATVLHQPPVFTVNHPLGMAEGIVLIIFILDLKDRETNIMTMIQAELLEIG